MECATAREDREIATVSVVVKGYQRHEPTNPSAENLAPAGVASQSSANHSGVASRVIDGNTNGVWRQGSVTHTANEAQPWWELELAARAAIEELVLYNRADSCCSGRLSNVHVFISETPMGDWYSTDSLLLQGRGSLLMD